MSKRNELKERELEAIVGGTTQAGGAKLEQAPAGEIPFVEYEPSPGASCEPRVGDVHTTC